MRDLAQIYSIIRPSAWRPSARSQKWNHNLNICYCPCLKIQCSAFDGVWVSVEMTAVCILSVDRYVSLISFSRSLIQGQQKVGWSQKRFSTHFFPCNAIGLMLNFAKVGGQADPFAAPRFCHPCPHLKLYTMNSRLENKFRLVFILKSTTYKRLFPSSCLACLLSITQKLSTTHTGGSSQSAREGPKPAKLRKW